MASNDHRINFWYVAFAVVGALVVLGGLLMEQYSEQRLPKNIKDFRRFKIIKLCGEWFVIGGVFIEFLVGIVSAIDAWQNEPLNRPISDISAIVKIRVKGRDNVELPSSTNDSPSVAAIYLCREIVSFTNVLKIGMYFEPTNDMEIHDPSGRPAREPITVPGFPMLKSDRFEVTKSSQFIFSHPDFHEYHMLFHSDAFSDLDVVVHKTKVKDISKIKALWIGLKFLPHDSEILEGIAVITVNDTRQIFFIQPQKDSYSMRDGSSTLNDFEIVTTNVIQIVDK